MALQKKNHLIRAHLIVALFWFVVLFFVLRGFDIPGFAHALFFGLTVGVLGILSGVVLWVSFDMSRTDSLLRAGGLHRFRGAKSSIGPVPVPVPAYKTARPAHVEGKAVIPETFLPKKFGWWPDYQKNYPAHAKAMRAVIRLMAQYPGLPASPVPGGHGGASLIDHSVNVVNTMMELAPKWAYRGHKNKKGEITFPLFDVTKTEHRFDRDDPILPLAALAHDVGKVICYELQKDGSVSEIRKNHDIEGARLLRTLPEIMFLPYKDRVALLTACEYYHHIGSIPLSSWIDDRARSLIELLIVADIETGRREGGSGLHESTDTSLPASAPYSKLGFDHSHSAAPSTPEENSVATPVQSPKSQASHSAGTGSSPGGTALDLAYSLLLEPGRVNGKDTVKRLAWKYEDRVYINDAKLRNAVSSRLGDTSYAILPHRGNMHPWTLELMELLASRQHLVQDHEGRHYSPKRAIFTTLSNVPDKSPVEQKFVIVAKVEAFPALANIPSCKSEPVIVGCSWGESAAMNKKGEDSVGQDDTATSNESDDPNPASYVSHEEISEALEKSSTEDIDLPYRVTELTGHPEPAAVAESADREVEAVSDDISNYLPGLDLEGQIRSLVQKMELPHRIQVIDGKKYFFVEESLVREKWPGVEINLFLAKGSSGIHYVRIKA